MTLLDMTGKPCPIPVINAKRALKTLAPGETISIIVDNEISKQNLEKMAEGLGHMVISSIEDSNFKVTITVGTSKSKDDSSESQGLVVAIGQDRMGNGPFDDESSVALGKMLIKYFIFSLTELDIPPEYLLFFNGGIFLTTEGSTVLDDLRILVEKGTVIGTCGACLNYYKKLDKLEIGAVTNMYAIVNAMSFAKRVINI
jgi:selenium metabolism protein YedF